MSTVIFLLKVIFVWACLVTTLSASREDVAQDFIEHVLKIPNPDRVLNSVLGRLERNRQGLLERLQPRFGEDADCEEPKNLPEYTESFQDSVGRGLRHLGSQKHCPICHLKRFTQVLNSNEYEYRPSYYDVVRCTHDGNDNDKNEECSSLGFSCIQWNKTIHLTRRRFSSDCWEIETRVIPAACECMRPLHMKR